MKQINPIHSDQEVFNQMENASNQSDEALIKTPPDSQPGLVASVNPDKISHFSNSRFPSLKKIASGIPLGVLLSIIPIGFIGYLVGILYGTKLVPSDPGAYFGGLSDMFAVIFGVVPLIIAFGMLSLVSRNPVVWLYPIIVFNVISPLVNHPLAVLLYYWTGVQNVAWASAAAYIGTHLVLQCGWYIIKSIKKTPHDIPGIIWGICIISIVAAIVPVSHAALLPFAKEIIYNSAMVRLPSTNQLSVSHADAKGFEIQYEDGSRDKVTLEWLLPSQKIELNAQCGSKDQVFRRGAVSSTPSDIEAIDNRTNYVTRSYETDTNKINPNVASGIEENCFVIQNYKYVLTRPMVKGVNGWRLDRSIPTKDVVKAISTGNKYALGCTACKASDQQKLKKLVSDTNKKKPAVSPYSDQIAALHIRSQSDAYQQTSQLVIAEYGIALPLTMLVEDLYYAYINDSVVLSLRKFDGTNCQIGTVAGKNKADGIGSISRRSYDQVVQRINADPNSPTSISGTKIGPYVYTLGNSFYFSTSSTYSCKHPTLSKAQIDDVIAWSLTNAQEL